MQAGELRARVGFYRPVIVSDDGAGNTISGFAPAPVFQTAANIRPRLGGEAMLAGRLSGRNVVNITVRASSATRMVDETWKVRDERLAIDYNVRSIVDPHEGDAQHGLWLEMLCEKGVAT